MINTINKEIKINSKGLMTGIDSEVIIKPSNTNGIRFHINNQTFEANIDNVISTDHCVVIGNKSSKIMLIEHFMASLSFLNINALDVYLNHFEMPILDGASEKWIEIFKNAKLYNNLENSVKYEIKEPINYIKGKTHIIILPCDTLKITYSINFNHPDLENRWVSYNLPQNNIFDDENTKQIIEARTFGYLNELEMLQKSGFAKGVTLENTLGLMDGGKYTSDLKSKYEPIKHKILDIIGDFRLSGYNPLNFKANIIVKEAGHFDHIEVCKILSNKLIKKENKNDRRN